MKAALLSLAVLLSATAASAQHSLEKLWVTDSVFATPESVLPDLKEKILYVSNIGDMQKEGMGSIGKLGLDGKVIEMHWVKGLNAPKGSGMYKGLLYVAEPTAVAVIDIAKAAVTKRIPVEGAVFLNDITIDPNGVVYVSDSRANRIHRIEKDKPSVFLEDTKGVNGLLAVQRDLYILADGKLMKADQKKQLSTITEGIEGGADGLVMVGKNEFVASGWAGVIYYINSKGEKQVLLDTREAKSNTADIGFDPATRTIYVPTFMKNTVAAYTLK